MQNNWLYWFRRTALIAALGSGGIGMSVDAQSVAVTSCDSLLMAAREVRGQQVGPTSCLMQETPVTIAGRPFRRLDIGLNGSVDGVVTRTGDYKEYLTNAPDLVFPQTADSGPRFLAVAQYHRDKGAAMTVVFPSSLGAWNGKDWVTVHGRGTSCKEGNLKAWDQNLDPARTKDGTQHG